MLQPPVGVHHRLCLEGVAHGSFQTPKFSLALEQVAEDSQTFLPEAALGFQAGLLWKVSHAQPARAHHAAQGWFFSPKQETQQGGFAYAVGANQADPRAVWNGKRNRAEYIQWTVGFSEIICS